MIAAKVGTLEYAQRLQDFSSGMEEDPAKRTALQYACYHGHQAVVELLINDKSVSLTAQAAAAMGGHLHIVES